MARPRPSTLSKALLWHPAPSPGCPHCAAQPLWLLRCATAAQTLSLCDCSRPKVPGDLIPPPRPPSWLQAALPGLSGFALGNCRNRYKVLAGRLDAIFRHHPGTNGQAMQVGGWGCPGEGCMWGGVGLRSGRVGREVCPLAKHPGSDELARVGSGRGGEPLPLWPLLSMLRCLTWQVVPWTGTTDPTPQSPSHAAHLPQLPTPPPLPPPRCCTSWRTPLLCTTPSSLLQVGVEVQGLLGM